MSLTKSEAIKDFAFVTLITEETHDSIINYALVYHREKIWVNIKIAKEMDTLSYLHISTTLWLTTSYKESQTSTIIALMKSLRNASSLASTLATISIMQKTSKCDSIQMLQPLLAFLNLA